jgi:hypothetical protein
MELKHRVIHASLTLLAAAGLSAACSESTITPPPTPTALRIDLETPNADDGALVLTVRGPGISTVQAASAGYLTYTRDSGPEETRVIVVGDLKAGAVLTLQIASGHHLQDYRATIQQVATRSDGLRDDVSAYRATVTLP